jgi:hypothetical protein
MGRRLKALALAAALAGGAGGWYLFRPERALIDRVVNEPLPSGGQVIRSARFESRAHDGRGTADIIAMSGRRVLRLTQFEVLDGPDLQVYLLRDAAASGRAGLAAGYVSLGALKGNVGNQWYEIPAEVDLDRFAGVSVWCRRFGVNFATATWGRRQSADAAAARAAAVK